ncbi:MAG: YfcE family phosphodiesterase [Ardenticatenaceae bacterium]|nr:YfcE family phosphodiesterase [Ardenticatenaceae bacterium]
MRIAIFSDIHGHLVALEAVLADVAREGIERMVCLGDVAANGPQPREVIARLRELGIPIVQGNTDEWLLKPQVWGQDSEFYRRIYEMEQWTADVLTADDQAFLRTFQPTVEIAVDAENALLCFHGTPRNNREILRATTQDEEVAEMVAGQTATILAGGHTHQPMVRRFEDKLIMNPGSVGLPYVQVGETEYNPPWAEYAILRSEGGHVGVELRRVRVEVTAVQAAILDSDLPHKEWLAGQWGD